MKFLSIETHHSKFGSILVFDTLKKKIKDFIGQSNSKFENKRVNKF